MPLSAGDNSEVTVGIRPESILLQGPADAPSLKANVQFKEVLGAEVLLHMESAAGQITVRTDAHTPAKEGENLQLFLPQEKLHLFDGASESRV